MKQIVLASASPRRKELLELLGLDFDIIPSRGEEIITKTDPEEAVKELAHQKAAEVSNRIMNEYHAGKSGHGVHPVKVIGADTIVVYQKKIYGKPADEAHAKQMLTSLQGNTHQVYTGVCVMTLFENQEDLTETGVTEFSEKTDVTMYPVSEKEILAYIAAGECRDKAGAYAIQGISARFIKEIHGDYNNVVGLPIARLWQECFRTQL